MTRIIHPVNFTGVETLRKRLFLTQEEIATLLGVQRQTYLRWTTGGRPHGNKENRVKDTVNKLATIAESGWPPISLSVRPSSERLANLRKLLETFD